MRPEIITRSATMPVSLDEVKRHCRMRPGDTSEDAHLTLLIDSAVEVAESELNRSLVETAYLLKMTGFPELDEEGERPIYLYRPPVVSVESVKYYNESNVLTTVSADDYQLDLSEDPRIIEGVDKDWPTDVHKKINSVEVRFTCNTVTVKSNIKLALCELVAGARKARGGVTPQDLKLMPHWFGIQRLLAAQVRHEL